MVRVSGTLKPAFKAGPSFLALAGNVFSASAMSDVYKRQVEDGEDDGEYDDGGHAAY